MKVSSINESNSFARRNMFIEYANRYMNGNCEETAENPIKTENKKLEKSKGIETLTTFSIFPKQVVNGKTIITA